MKTDIIVFLGPSLPKVEATRILSNALYLPPVRCGDILKVLRLKPKIIAIIDGFFENTAAVWHKEILYALQQGVQVYGAASMGALRASELNEFGMFGIGHIYEDYSSGKLYDDDEVCVLHLPETSNYLPLTDAMVNIRVTLQKAKIEGIIDEVTLTILLDIAKNQNYKERILKAIINLAKKEVANVVLERFQEWLGHFGIVNQKAADAKEMLQHLTSLTLEKNLFSEDFKVNPSLYLRTLQLDIACQPFVEDNINLPLTERVALHARLLGKEYLLNYYLAYLLAAQYAINAQGYSLEDLDDIDIKLYLQYVSILTKLDQIDLHNSDTGYALNLIARFWTLLDYYIKKLNIVMQFEGFQTYANSFRIEHGLLTADSTYAWMQKQNLDGSQFEKMLMSFYHFEYFVLKNNFDQLGIFLNTEHYWFLEALKLSGTYERAASLVNTTSQCS